MTKLKTLTPKLAEKSSLFLLENIEFCDEIL